jgi:hypothetical protein
MTNNNAQKLNGSSSHTLEERIVAALQDPAISPSELIALISDTECGLVDAVQIAERMHEVAVDPLQSADATKAQKTAQLAQLIVKRLENVIPRLQQKHLQVVAQQRRKKWNEAADLTEKNRDFLAKEFAELVPQWTNKLLELFQRVLVMNAEVENLNAVAPSSEGRRLQSLGFHHLLANTKLLDLAGQRIWPPPPAPININTLVPHLPAGGDWHTAIAERDAERRREGARVAAHYDRMAREREDKENAAARAARARNGGNP